MDCPFNNHISSQFHGPISPATKKQNTFREKVKLFRLQSRRKAFCAVCKLICSIHTLYYSAKFKQTSFLTASLQTHTDIFFYKLLFCKASGCNDAQCTLCFQYFMDILNTSSLQNIRKIYQSRYG